MKTRSIIGLTLIGGSVWLALADPPEAKPQFRTTPPSIVTLDGKLPKELWLADSSGAPAGTTWEPVAIQSASTTVQPGVYKAVPYSAVVVIPELTDPEIVAAPGPVLDPKAIVEAPAVTLVPLNPAPVIKLVPVK